MSYTVKSSEKLRKTGAETETKALLYLMNFMADSDDIYYFVVDFFNDLTGMNNMATRLWDVQSKGAHNVGPKAIGKELVTLFKNYMSEFTFEAYILFVGSVSGTLRKDPSLDVFGIDNVKDAAIKLIKEGLNEEGRAKEYIDNSSLTDTSIDDFLKSVLFVIDEDKDPREYVRAIIASLPHSYLANSHATFHSVVQYNQAVASMQIARLTKTKQLKTNRPKKLRQYHLYCIHFSDNFQKAFLYFGDSLLFQNTLLSHYSTLNIRLHFSCIPLDNCQIKMPATSLKMPWRSSVLHQLFEKPFSKGL